MKKPYTFFRRNAAPPPTLDTKKGITDEYETVGRFLSKVVIEEDYLIRWFLLPRNRFFNIYLHRYLGSDPGRALHDHPWHSVSILLRGGLIEQTYADPGKHYGTDTFIPARCGLHYHFARIRRFIPKFRRARAVHRVQLVEEWGEAWTLFITGPKVREWGFLTNGGWVHYSEYKSGAIE